MRVTVTKWGNSLGIRVPRAVARDLQLGNGSVVELEPRDGAYVMRSSNRAPMVRCELIDLVDRMGKVDEEPRELDWGPRRGTEAW